MEIDVLDVNGKDKKPVHALEHMKSEMSLLHMVRRLLWGTGHSEQRALKSALSKFCQKMGPWHGEEDAYAIEKFFAGERVEIKEYEQ